MWSLQTMWMLLQRYRPVLTESFVEGLHSRGVDVDAVRIEPGAHLRHIQRRLYRGCNLDEHAELVPLSLPQCNAHAS